MAESILVILAWKDKRPPTFEFHKVLVFSLFLAIFKEIRNIIKKRDHGCLSYGPRITRLAHEIQGRI